MPPLASRPDREAAGAGATPTPTVYLCQVSQTVSCGACCGLYNIAGLSRTTLHERLARRSRRFADTPRTEDAIDGFRRDVEGWTPEDRPFPQFHHCPFLGLVGRTANRVGCLLHPDAPGNHGRDWRYLSFYGTKACAAYFCPASRRLPTHHLLILKGLFDDWYPYGLIITEHRLLRAAFSILETLLGRTVGPPDFAPDSAAAEGLRHLLTLKLAWPYRSHRAPGPCHFPFDNGLYPRRPIDWPAGEGPDPRYAIFFEELDSRFQGATDVRRAIAVLDRHVAFILARL